MSDEAKTTQAPAADPKQEPAGAAPAGAAVPPAKTFTQEDVARIAAKESKSAVEKLLKEAGYDAEDGDYQKSLETFRKQRDSGLAALKALETDKAAALAKAESLERRLTAMDKGVPAAMADKYAKLAESYVSDDVDFAAALELALKDFPVQRQGAPGTGGNPASGAATPESNPNKAYLDRKYGDNPYYKK